MTSISNPQLDFSEKKSLVSKYKFTKLVQQTGSTQFTIPVGANPETIFELPPRVFNMSRSVLNFTAIPETNAALMVWAFQDCIAPIRQVQVYTRSGVYLCDVNNVDKYTAIVLKSDVNTEDARVQDIGADDGEMYCSFGDVAGCSLINYTYDGDSALGRGVIVGAVPGTGNYYEPQYLRAAYGAAAALAPTMNISIPLSLIKNTLLALDKPLYYNEPLMFKIVWNTALSWGFGSTAIDDPTAGVAALVAGISITNMYLHLALEQNPIIAAGVVSSVVTKGLNVVVPYVYGYVNVGTAGSTAQTVSVRLNRANGMKLKKIYHGIFNVDAVVATRYDHRNVAGAICTAYWTAVNNNRLQETDVSVARNEDFNLLKEVLPNSIAASSLNTYRRNWFIIDKFDENLVDEKNGIVNDGLDLSTEIKWDCNGTVTNVVHNYYTFAVVSRMLMITPQGIMIQ